MGLSVKIFIWYTFAYLAKVTDSQATCGLQGVTSSPENLFRVPITSDYLVNKTLIWEPRMFGQVDKTSADSHPHFKYIAATHTSSFYRMYSNSITRYFPRETDSHEIIRNTTIHCKDGSYSKYYLSIPLQDMTPPQFTQILYTLNITTNWDITRPISEGKFIIVSDNDYKLGKKDEPPKLLSFHTSIDNLLTIKSVKLWVQDDPEKFYYRLDLYFKEINPLPVGRTEVKLSALDDFNSGYTNIEIFVTTA